MPTVATSFLLRQVPMPAQGHRNGWRRTTHEARELVRTEALIDATYCNGIVALQPAADERFHVAGAMLHAPRLVPPSGRLTGLGCVVCTLGAKLEERVRMLFLEKRPSLALALDMLGTEMLFALSRRAQDRLLTEAMKKGLTLHGEARPGDPGLALEAQETVLGIGGAARIGVTMRSGYSLHPAKSISAVFGVGVDLPESHWSRCDECPSASRCRLASGRKRVPA